MYVKTNCKLEFRFVAQALLRSYQSHNADDLLLTRPAVTTSFKMELEDDTQKLELGNVSLLNIQIMI